MKRIAILAIPILATFLLSGNAISQQKPDRDCSMAVADTSVVYSYDAAGNRIKRRPFYKRPYTIQCCIENI